MKVSKKILAIALSVMLLFSVIPFTVASAETGVANGAELKAAIADAQDGDVIEFTADVTEYPATSGALVIPVDGKDITIDLKGHTQYFRVSGETAVSYPTDLFVLKNGAKLTVIDSVGGGAIYATYGANSSAYIFNVLDSSELVINGGQFVMDKANRGGVIVYQNSADASTTINAGTFQTVTDPNATRNYRNHIVNDTRGEVEINGGTFTTGQAFDYVISEGNTTDASLTINDGEFNGSMSLDTTKATTTINGGTYLTTTGEPNTDVSAYLPINQIVDKTTGEIKNVAANTVARTNSDEFATIDAAFAAIASSTGTIELNILENVTATSVLTLNNAQVLKIYLNGKTITADGNGKTAANVPHIKVYPGTQLSIYGPGSIVTANTPNPYDGALIKVYGAADDSGAASKTFIYDGAVISSSGYGISLFPAAGTKAAYNASISISNGTVENTSTHDAAAIAVSGNIQTGDSVITVSKATITGNSTKGVGVFVGGMATVNFTSSSVATVSGATGIYQKGGTVNFGKYASNVSVIGNGASADYKYYGNGFVATGDAYVIDNCGYPAGVPVSTINNSIFTSTNGEAVASYVKQDDVTQTADFERVDEIIPATSTAVFSSDVTALAVDGYETVYDEEASGYVVEKDTHSVAEANGVKYDSFDEALRAISTVNAQGQFLANGTVTLLADCTGNGYSIATGSNLTIDFNGKTYTVNAEPLAGSTGTKTQAFQLLKDSTVTFKNGTLNSTVAKFLIQNYADLTLENMVLDINNPNYASAYTLSTNNGSTTISGTTINANPAGGVAFDVCTGWGNYAENTVIVNDDSVINGDIEVSDYGQAGAQATLNLVDGTFNGDIITSQGAEEVAVNKDEGFVAAAPAGYEWVDGGEGIYTLAEIQTADGYSLTIGEKIEVNFAINASSVPGGTIVVNGVDANAESAEKSDKTFNIASLPTITGGDYDGDVVVTLDVAPAQLAENFNIKVYDANGNLVDEFNASVYDYATSMMADPTYGELMKSLINYGALAAEYFGYNGATIEASADYKDDLSAAEQEELISRRAAGLTTGNAGFDGMVYFAKVEPEFKFYFVNTNAGEAQLGADSTGLSVVLTKTDDGVAAKVTGLKASDFGKTFSVTVDGTTLTVNGYAYIASALKSNSLNDLATGLFRYAQAAEAVA